jgi:hypothetical protein
VLAWTRRAESATGKERARAGRERVRPQRRGRRQEARRKGERGCGQREALTGAIHARIVAPPHSTRNAELVPSPPLLVRFRQATRRAGGWSLTIRTVVKDVQTTVREWAQDVTSRVGTVDGSTGRAWPSANRFVPRAPAPFVETTVAKRQAVSRGECGVIDADVDLGDRVPRPDAPLAGSTGRTAIAGSSISSSPACGWVERGASVGECLRASVAQLAGLAVDVLRREPRVRVAGVLELGGLARDLERVERVDHDRELLGGFLADRGLGGPGWGPCGMPAGWSVNEEMPTPRRLMKLPAT